MHCSSTLSSSFLNQGRQYRLPHSSSAQYVEANSSENTFRILVFRECMLEDFNTFVSIMGKKASIRLLLMKHHTEAKLTDFLNHQKKKNLKKKNWKMLIYCCYFSANKKTSKIHNPCWTQTHKEFRNSP